MIQETVSVGGQISFCTRITTNSSDYAAERSKSLERMTAARGVVSTICSELWRNRQLIARGTSVEVGTKAIVGKGRHRRTAVSLNERKKIIACKNGLDNWTMGTKDKWRLCMHSSFGFGVSPSRGLKHRGLLAWLNQQYTIGRIRVYLVRRNLPWRKNSRFTWGFMHSIISERSLGDQGLAL